jgi:hypothetical protein
MKEAGIVIDDAGLSVDTDRWEIDGSRLQSTGL